MGCGMKQSTELMPVLDKLTSRKEALKLVYQWVKTGTINFKTFDFLVWYVETNRGWQNG